MIMTNNRPYIARALYEWIVDNNGTPYILVDSHWPGIILPAQFKNEDNMVLNVSPMATRDFLITNESISFLACINGATHSLVIPIEATLAIYAQENGQGMVFDPMPYPEAEDTAGDDAVNEGHAKKDKSLTLRSSKAPAKKSRSSKGRPSLKVIK